MVEIGHPDTVTIDVRPYKSVALTVSGGLDSASLLFMICESAIQHHLEDSFKIFAFTVPNRGDVFCGYFAALVVQKAQNHFHNKVIIEHIVHNSSLGGKYKTEAMEAFQKEMARTGKIEAFFDGVTLNPTDPSFQFQPPGGDYVKKMSHRDFDCHQPKTVKKQAYHIDYCRPLANVDKRFVRDYFQKHGLLEEMIEITRSCTDFNSVECGCCWWCQERQWVLNCVP
ncbi:MAG: hypothetical protein KDD61_01395 [Bdellovibrionales bacterium]|nr:hypothetical protein [Bdellovibrionales bacterium]